MKSFGVMLKLLLFLVLQVVFHSASTPQPTPYIQRNTAAPVAKRHQVLLAAEPRDRELQKLRVVVGAVGAGARHGDPVGWPVGGLWLRWSFLEEMHNRRWRISCAKTLEGHFLVRVLKIRKLTAVLAKGQKVPTRGKSSSSVENFWANLGGCNRWRLGDCIESWTKPCKSTFKDWPSMSNKTCPCQNLHVFFKKTQGFFV